jgi:hypothetical protein
MVAVDTITTVNKLTDEAGEEITLIAHVNDEENNLPVYEGQLTFTVATTEIDTVNIVNGVASKTWTIPTGWTSDDYTITAVYVGTDNYNTSTGTNTLTIPATPPLPKSGFDTAWAKDRIVDYFYTLIYDKDLITDPDVPVFPNGKIYTGSPGKISLYSGVSGLFGVGDTTEIEEGLRGQPRWANHKAELLLATSGETTISKDTLEEARRIIENNIRVDPSLGLENIAVFIPETNPVKRYSITQDDPLKVTQPRWNSALLLFFDVKLAEVP